MGTTVKFFVALIIIFAVSLDVAGEADNVKQKTAACAGCHGADGNSVSGNFPKLAGQYKNYLKQQIKAFKDGSRIDEMMQSMVTNLSNQDIEDISGYYAKQKIKFNSDEDQYLDEDEEIEVTPELINIGQKLYRGGNRDTGVAACIACHGPNGLGNEPARFPLVKGQYAFYVAKSLKGFKSGERNNDMSSMMQMVAKKMTMDEIHAVSSYISSLR